MDTHVCVGVPSVHTCVCVGVMSVHTCVCRCAECARVCVGVPTLVLVDEDNKIISQNARFVVANDVEGKV